MLEPKSSVTAALKYCEREKHMVLLIIRNDRNVYAPTIDAFPLDISPGLDVVSSGKAYMWAVCNSRTFIVYLLIYCVDCIRTIEQSPQEPIALLQ